MPNHDEEIRLLREEVELLMSERELLLQIVGAAAGLVASLDSNRLPVGAIESADMVSTLVNALPEEALQDALNSVHAHTDAASGDKGAAKALRA